MSKRMMLDLERLLEVRGLTRYELAKRTGIQYQTIDSYYKNRVVRYDSYILLRLCTELKCEVGELLRIVEEE